jgi:hypothetical protein
VYVSGIHALDLLKQTMSENKKMYNYVETGSVVGDVTAYEGPNLMWE